MSRHRSCPSYLTLTVSCPVCDGDMEVDVENGRFCQVSVPCDAKCDSSYTQQEIDQLAQSASEEADDYEPTWEDD